MFFTLRENVHQWREKPMLNTKPKRPTQLQDQGIHATPASSTQGTPVLSPKSHRAPVEAGLVDIRVLMRRSRFPPIWTGDEGTGTSEQGQNLAKMLFSPQTGRYFGLFRPFTSKKCPRKADHFPCVLEAL
jgi:hypothetical protein